MAAIRETASEIHLNLSACNSFEEMKRELERRLSLAQDCSWGSRISITAKAGKLTLKQTQEIKTFLAERGLRLHDLIIKSEIRGEEENEFFENFSHYEETALICRHLRSGNKFFTDGNVVILGDVNPGAEIIAGGNILVMGSLRGMVHAGASGDEKAIIVTYRLIPTQLRIADHITRPPDGEVVLVDSPEMARIRSGKVCIEKLKI